MFFLDGQQHLLFKKKSFAAETYSEKIGPRYPHYTFVPTSMILQLLFAVQGVEVRQMEHSCLNCTGHPKISHSIFWSPWNFIDGSTIFTYVYIYIHIKSKTPHDLCKRAGGHLQIHRHMPWQSQSSFQNKGHLHRPPRHTRERIDCFFSAQILYAMIWHQSCLGLPFLHVSEAIRLPTQWW